MPPPVRSRSADEPHCGARLERGEERPARFAQSDDPDPDRATRPFEPGLEHRVADRLHRRNGLTDATVGEHQGRQLDRPEVEPDEDSRTLRREGRLDQLGRLDREVFVQVAGVDRRRPRDLHVVPGVVPERRSDQALEPSRIGRRHAHLGGPDPVRRRPRAHAPKIATSAGGTPGREPIPDPAREPRQSIQEPFGQPRGQPGREHDEPHPGPLDQGPGARGDATVAAHQGTADAPRLTALSPRLPALRASDPSGGDPDPAGWRPSPPPARRAIAPRPPRRATAA